MSEHPLESGHGLVIKLGTYVDCEPAVLEAEEGVDVEFVVPRIALSLKDNLESHALPCHT